MDGRRCNRQMPLCAMDAISKLAAIRAESEPPFATTQFRDNFRVGKERESNNFVLPCGIPLTRSFLKNTRKLDLITGLLTFRLPWDANN